MDGTDESRWQELLARDNIERLFFFFLATLAFSCGMWHLVPWLGIEPRPPALGVRNLNHWSTGEVPTLNHFVKKLLSFFSIFLMVPKRITHDEHLSKLLVSHLTKRGQCSSEVPSAGNNIFLQFANNTGSHSCLFGWVRPGAVLTVACLGEWGQGQSSLFLNK